MPSFAFALLLTLSLQTKYAMPLAISVRSDTPVVPMVHQGKAYLVYELEMFSYNPTPCELTEISVRNGKGKVIASLSGDALDKCLVHQSLVASPHPRIFDPAKLVVAYMWVELRQNSIPSEINHKLTFKRDDSGPSTVSGAPIKISTQRPVIVQPPLEGSHWIAGDAPSNISGHRRSRMTVNGHSSIGQRFAVDWFMINDNGVTCSGPPDKNESYFAYGRNVFACADAKVAVVVDGLKENVPHNNSMAVVITQRTIPGNHVILDLGHGIYAAYAHMIPGSIRFKPGQRVRAGQIIGKLGNSGNSEEPHLHFQIMNAPDFLASEGIPFGHPSLTVQPADLTIDKDLKVKLKGRRTKIKNQMPMENDCVDFHK